MRIAKPKFKHPPEVHLAIAREHGDNAVRLGERLQQLGWTLADAAWAAVHWDVAWLAAAIANARDQRGMSLTVLGAAGLEALRMEIAVGNARGQAKPRKTTRIVRTSKLPDAPPGTSTRPAKP